MFLSPYPEKEAGQKVWLEQHELDRWIEQAEGTEQRIAFQLMGYSGLRSAEVLDVTAEYIVETNAGPRVRVWDGKGGKDRETIASDDLVSLADAIVDVGGRLRDAP